jgi:hypothetical protein
LSAAVTNPAEQPTERAGVRGADARQEHDGRDSTSENLHYCSPDSGSSFRRYRIGTCR